MIVYGAVAFDQSDEAEQARSLLESEGYEVELQGQEDDSVVLTAIPPVHVSSAEALEAKMRAVASQFKGEFLGRGGSFEYVLRGHS